MRRSVWLAVAVMAACLMPAGAAYAQAACPASGAERIVCENRRPGVPQETWDVSGAGDPSIQGFSTAISVTTGERVDFKVDTDAAAYHLEIHRVGYYGGLGARRVDTVRPSVALPVEQPECLSDPSTGLIDCGNWRVTASWRVPDDAVSGVYFARLVREDTGGASLILFIVREDRRRSDLGIQVSDTTWQAYNDYGGNSLYSGRPVGRAYKVSYNRPLVTRANQYGRTNFWATSYPMVRWLEANGYDVTYSTGVDTHRDGEALLRHKVFLSMGHDEYWSAAQRAHVEAARDAGVHLAFFSGNTMFWRTRWEDAVAGEPEPLRTLVSYKETHANAKIDPLPVATGTWRDPRFGLGDQGARPENAVTGTLFVTNCCRFDTITVSAEQARARFWRQTTVATLGPGESASVGTSIVGFEWDGDVDNEARPRGLIRLSATPVAGAEFLADFGSFYRGWPETASHNLTLYRHESGALVFSAGLTHWGWALDGVHDDPDLVKAPTDPAIQQATVNLFADMGVQPGSLQAGLRAGEASTDVTPPIAAIDSPASGEHPFYARVDVTGSVTDVDGVPAGVEVSIDGGQRWHPAEGVSPWRYSFRPTERGLVYVLARAVDDSGNVQPLPAWIAIDVIGLSGYRGTIVIGVATVGVIGLAAAGILVVWMRRRKAGRDR